MSPASTTTSASNVDDTERLTVGQAIVRFLTVQQVERDGHTQPFFGGALGIFGHGNLAGLGQAMLQHQDDLRYFQARNEQGMVHMATGYAKMRNRLGAMACSSSIGPGATNMVTGAATATVNRLPVLLLPGDFFSTRRSGAVLQQLESSWSQDLSVNDAFKPVSRYWDRINRPEQLPQALMEAMRTLTSPADTGAVTIALPQDVQAQAWDFPTQLFKQRIWHVARQRPDREALRRAAAAITQSKRPIIIAGGGVIYSEATEQLCQFAESTGIPVGVTQAGKAGMPYDHTQALGSIGVSGSAFANHLANEADLVIGIGTRYTDFTTASNTLFQNPDVQFVNINVAELDAVKEAGIPLTGDARETLTELLDVLDGWSVDAAYRQEGVEAADRWRAEVDTLVAPSGGDGLAQADVIGIVNQAAGPRDVVVNAAGSLPGDLHRLWRSGDPKGYDMEYGFSCMGYEVAGALGAKIADPSREVFAFVGDGSWLMMSQEIMTSVQEGLKLTVILVDNHGYGSIGALSETLGSQGFGTRFTHRGDDGRLSGDRIAIDLPANARSLGADVLEASTADQLRSALAKAAESDHTTVIYTRVDEQGRFGGSGAWWDVPVAETSTLETTQAARATYAEMADQQRRHL
jgi:3D-(3,5/4)-trihydroxycyclohexane-1,2-dione acylhydrolase (decyclizing)